MSKVTADDVSRVRAQTGAGITDCQRALENHDNNIKLAVECLRTRGQAVVRRGNWPHKDCK